MKQTLALLLTLVLLPVMSACAGSSASAENTESAVVQEEVETQEEAVKEETETAAQETTVKEEATGTSEQDAAAESATEQEIKSSENKPEETLKENGEKMIYAHVGEQVLEILPADNSSAEAFIDLLAEGDVTVDMHDYGNFEKVGSLGAELVRNDEDITTEPGDVILYLGNQVSIYYDINTWDFTRLGKVQGLSQEELKEVLGDGDVSVTFSLSASEGTDAQAGVFDFDEKKVLLNSGYEMPILGLGTYSLDYDTCVNSVMSLLENGGRLIDTAYMYHNEEAVGEGVRRAMEEYGIPREDIFVITKIYPSQFDDPEAAIELALEKLNIDYIDMMLLHHPGENDVEAYKAMEKYVEQGRIHSLGLSNWYVEELTEFLPQVTIGPALVQNEIHPYYQEQDVVPFIQDKGIVVQCWYPLGGRGNTKELLENETITAIAHAHGVSSAQVILRWDLQRGIVVIPGSSNPEHIKENLDLFGFELSDEEMEKIAGLDRNEKHDWY